MGSGNGATPADDAAHDGRGWLTYDKGAVGAFRPKIKWLMRDVGRPCSMLMALAGLGLHVLGGVSQHDCLVYVAAGWAIMMVLLVTDAVRRVEEDRNARAPHQRSS